MWEQTCSRGSVARCVPLALMGLAVASKELVQIASSLEAIKMSGFLRRIEVTDAAMGSQGLRLVAACSFLVSRQRAPSLIGKLVVGNGYQ
jgi:hypothetical protein